ncbi:MAG TPA: hypothetical protein VN228_10575 [Pyrinomonadaceae bacterium]|nr:hypothetical protein [Pyrinomonadaceae bacterium]
MSKEGRDGADESPSKRELQRQMDEARDSISETVAEIKTVVAQQYEEVRERVETVREGVGEVLDWREQFERNPVVWGAGAVSVGILIGIGLSRAFDGDEGPPRRGRRAKEPGAGQRLMGELTGLADAVLPTISGKIKEMFGLDLTAYLEETRRKQLAEKPARPRAAKKRGAAKSKARKGGAKKGSAKKGRTKAS